MRSSLPAAVVAAADPGLCSLLPLLLADADVALAAVASNGVDALQAVLRHRPSLLVADAGLPALNGTLLAEKLLLEPSVPVRPRVLLLHRGEFPLPDRAKLESAGAGFLPWPADGKAFCRAVRSMLEAPPCFPPAQQIRADALLDALGVPAHPGRECLRLAALLCAGDERLLQNRRAALYPQIARLAGCAPRGVERAMRHAIGLAWQSDKFDNQYRIFADTVDAGRGQPTCGEMIARLADILRLEG